MQTMKNNIIKSILVFALCSFMLLVSGFTGAQDSLAATSKCFWMENYSGQYKWVPTDRASSKEECYALDSCDGGLGQSGGGCYKWATDANATREPWETNAKASREPSSSSSSCYYCRKLSDQEECMPDNQISSKEECYEIHSQFSDYPYLYFKWASSPNSEGQPWN